MSYQAKKGGARGNGLSSGEHTLIDKADVRAKYRRERHEMNYEKIYLEFEMSFIRFSDVWHRLGDNI